MRISVLTAALAPALIAVIVAATADGAGALRVAVICAVASAVAVVALLRQSRLGYGKDLAARGRDRERLDEQLTGAREEHAETMGRLAGRERELATVRERETRLREGETRLRERVAKLEARARDLEGAVADADNWAKRAEARAADAQTRALDAEKRAADLDALVWDLPSRPMRLTQELFTRGAAALRNLENAGRPTAPVPAQAAAPVEADEPASPVDVVGPARSASSVERTERTEQTESVEAPEPAAPAAPVAESVEPVESAEPAPARPEIPGVRHRPISVEGLVPAYAASMYGVRPAAPIAPRQEIPAARLPVPRPPAEVAVPERAVGDAPDLDLGIDSLEPAVAALPADDAVARVVRDVADTVRATTQRMSRSEGASSFDFFGRQLPAAAEAAEAPDTDVPSEADSEKAHELDAVEAESTPEPAPEATPEPNHAAPRTATRAPRDAGPRVETGPRPLLTHEPRTGRPIPVDLTAHDDTEQLPRIVDDRKHA